MRQPLINRALWRQDVFKPCIMAVDDEQIVRKVLSATLSRDYEVILLPSGDQLQRLLQAFHPDLIMLDVRMPGMNGFDLCRSIRSMPAYQTVPVVLLSALREEKNRRSGIEAGADFYITKPFDVPELRHLISKTLHPPRL